MQLGPLRVPYLPHSRLVRVENLESLFPWYVPSLSDGSSREEVACGKPQGRQETQKVTIRSNKIYRN